jgi:hypothetical protein
MRHAATLIPASALVKHLYRPMTWSRMAFSKWYRLKSSSHATCGMVATAWPRRFPARGRAVALPRQSAGLLRTQWGELTISRDFAAEKLAPRTGYYNLAILGDLRLSGTGPIYPCLGDFGAPLGRTLLTLPSTKTGRGTRAEGCVR